MLMSPFRVKRDGITVDTFKLKIKYQYHGTHYAFKYQFNKIVENTRDSKNFTIEIAEL